MKNSKLPGRESILLFVIKMCSESAPHLIPLFCFYFNLIKIPTSWEQTVVLNIPKRDDSSESSTYGSISTKFAKRIVFENFIPDHFQSAKNY